jgi:hypothetical protein
MRIRNRIRLVHRVGLVALGVALLAGCTPEVDAGDGETEAPVVDPTPSDTATTAPPLSVFEMPTRCADILTGETQNLWAGGGMDLLGGPDGKYGENYFGDPTPEERAGGITCVWGDEDVTASTVIVSVAPITTATRSGIVSALIDTGLVESQIDGGLTYARIGDDVSAPAELHVIRAESWVSVIEAVGGEERFQQATELVDEVTERVYVAG